MANGKFKRNYAQKGNMVSLKDSLFIREYTGAGGIKVLAR